MTTFTPPTIRLSFRRSSSTSLFSECGTSNLNERTGNQIRCISGGNKPCKTHTMPPLIPTLSDHLDHMTLASSSQFEPVSPSPSQLPTMSITTPLPCFKLQPKSMLPSLFGGLPSGNSSREALPKKRTGKVVQKTMQISLLATEASNFCATSQKDKSIANTAAMKVGVGVKSPDGWANSEGGGSWYRDVPVSPPRKMTLKRRRCSSSQDAFDGDSGRPSCSRTRLPLYPYF
jgi:hypothetical protein